VRPRTAFPLGQLEPRDRKPGKRREDAPHSKASQKVGTPPSRRPAFAQRPTFDIFPVPMSILINSLLVVWTVIALLMILVILMQRPKSEGLGAAFGGGVTENIFGAQTTNVLVKFTGYLAAIFFLLTFGLSILYAKRSAGNSALRQELMKTQSGAATATASASPRASVQPSQGVSSSPGASAVPTAASPGASPAASIATVPAGPSPAASTAASPTEPASQPVPSPSPR